MTGFSSAQRTFWRAFAVVAGALLLAFPSAAIPIATGSLGPEAFDNTIDFRVVTNNGGQANTLPQFLVPGATPGAPATAVITSSPYTLTLNNSLAAGSVITAAMLNLDFTATVSQGSTSVTSCTGGNCTNYGTAGIVPNTYGAIITVVSESGTTYTWNYQTASASFSLNLLTADPDFADDLANGDDLTVSWTQTIGLSGTYTPNSGSSNNRCRSCTMVFSTPVNGSTTLSGTVDATVGQPPDPNPVPEPSTGLLLGLGLIATSATLRRKFFPR